MESGLWNVLESKKGPVPQRNFMAPQVEVPKKFENQWTVHGRIIHVSEGNLCFKHKAF